MINILLTIVWLSAAPTQPDEIVQVWTDSLAYCETMKEQVLSGDGADYAECSYTPPM